MAEFHDTDLDICSRSIEETPFCSHVSIDVFLIGINIFFNLFII